jgi:copper chaperone CopZ
MEKKIYVVGLDSDTNKEKAEEAVKAITGVNSVIANCEKSQVFVDFDESIADIEANITTALESTSLTILN